MGIKRPTVDMDGELDDEIVEYCEREGLRKPHAIRALIEAGLEAEGLR